MQLSLSMPNFEILKSKAEEGDVEAQVNTARCYHHGRGVVKNMGQACVWYTKAADQGSVDAIKALFGLLREIAIISTDEALLSFYNNSMRPKAIPHSEAKSAPNS